MGLDPNKIKPFYEAPKIPAYYRTRTLVDYPTRTTMSWIFNHAWLEQLIRYELPNGVWIAGGAALSECTNGPIVDVDMFCANAEAFCNAYELLSKDFDPDVDQTVLENASKNVKLVNFTRKSSGNASEQPEKVQLIKHYWFTGPEHVIDSFDFTVCQVAFGRETVTFNGQTEIDMDAKALRIHRIQWPVATLDRIAKYLTKGYQLVDPADLQRIASILRNPKLNKHEDIYTDPTASVAVISINAQQPAKPKLNLSKPPKFDLNW